jgi:hypothetical protein
VYTIISYQIQFVWMNKNIYIISCILILCISKKKKICRMKNYKGWKMWISYNIMIQKIDRP